MRGKEDTQEGTGRDQAKKGGASEGRRPGWKEWGGAQLSGRTAGLKGEVNLEGRTGSEATKMEKDAVVTGQALGLRKRG